MLDSPKHAMGTDNEKESDPPYASWLEPASGSADTRKCQHSMEYFQRLIMSQLHVGTLIVGGYRK